jgi:hypothetical protein
MKNKELKEFIHNNVYQNPSNGYVLTPSRFAFHSIKKLPKAVFESNSTTFCDPICKSGTFFFEIVEELYGHGHSIKNIESRLFTIDSNSHSLNVANSTIKKIINKLSGSFKVDYKYDFVERYYNSLIFRVSDGKYTTFDQFLSIIMVDKANKYLMEELQKNISDFIVQYEKISKLESKLFGEVFTPRKLIDKMLDTLPIQVWRNKYLKWLDPAVGIGNFPAAILDRLMVGLADEIKDEFERKKYILEEMLYFCDISNKNLFLLYKIFDCNNEFKLNVYRGSYLKEEFNKHMKEVWKLNFFDVIIGNPPYQDGSKDGGQNKIYNDFCKKSFSLLSKNGKILFITPISVLKKSKRFSLISKKGLKIVDFTSNNFFNVGIKTCSWLFDSEYDGETVTVVAKNEESQEFNINDEILDTSEVDLDFLRIKKNLKELASTPEKRMFLQNSVDATNGRSNIETDVFKYPVFKIKNGGREFVQFNKPTPKLSGMNKIIFSLTKSVSSYSTDTHDYDVNHMFTGVDGQDQIDNILSFMLSDYFISHCDKWKKSDGYGFNNALKYLPPFDKNTKWTNEMVKNFIENINDAK